MEIKEGENMTMIFLGLGVLLLHRLGFFTHLLRVCRMDGEPQKTQSQPTGRAKLEAEAGYILEMQGKNPRTVASMGDEMLTAIIREYLITKEIL